MDRPLFDFVEHGAKATKEDEYDDFWLHRAEEQIKRALLPDAWTRFRAELRE